jgi:hypothetical protein
LATNLVAVDKWYISVQDDDVVTCARHVIKRVAPIKYDVHYHPLSPQHGGHGHGKFGVVFDNQNSHDLKDAPWAVARRLQHGWLKPKSALSSRNTL